MFANLIFVTLVTIFVHSEAQVRIVGGKPAREGDFPYQAYLFFYQVKGESGFMCSGTLISNQYILTAGHCVTLSKNPSQLKNHVKVLLGTTNRRKFLGVGLRSYEVSKENFIRHPKYIQSSKDHDIALIKLPEPVEFSKYIKPAHLPSSYQTEKDLIGKTIITSGWGQLDAISGDTPKILQYMKTTAVAGDDCHKEFPAFIKFDSNTKICINSPVSTFCDGDSGGPNVIRENGVNTVVGITSVAFPDCDLGKPQILEKVSSHLDWISQNTGIAV